MKAGWRVLPLGDVVDISSGGTPSKDRDDYWRGDIPWVSPKDMKSDIITDSEDHISEAAVSGSATRLIKADALLLVVRSGILARTIPIARAGRDLTINQDIKALTPSDRLDSQFLAHFLKSRERHLLDKVTRGATVHKLDTPVIRSLPIPLPPLDEQKRIVAVLDEAFEGLSRARANAEANLTDARELFAAALKAEFARSPDEWREVALSEIGKTVTGSTPRTSEAGNFGCDLPFIKPGDFLPDGRLDYENDGLSKKGAAVSRILPTGCALMVCIGATIGKAGYSEREIATNQQINALVPTGGISGEFIYLQMISPDFQREVLRNAGQATLPIINKSKWSTLRVRVPKNLVWQHEITDRMRTLRDVISDLEERYSAAHLSLDTLRQSLLKKAFSGDLT